MTDERFDAGSYRPRAVGVKTNPILSTNVSGGVPTQIAACGSGTCRTRATRSLRRTTTDVNAGRVDSKPASRCRRVDGLPDRLKPGDVKPVIAMMTSQRYKTERLKQNPLCALNLANPGLFSPTFGTLHSKTPHSHISGGQTHHDQLSARAVAHFQGRHIHMSNFNDSSDCAPPLPSTMGPIGDGSQFPEQMPTDLVPILDRCRRS